MSSYQYKDSHSKYKGAPQPFFYGGNPYAYKGILYWNGALVIQIIKQIFAESFGITSNRVNTIFTTTDSHKAVLYIAESPNKQKLGKCWLNGIYILV